MPNEIDFQIESLLPANGIRAVFLTEGDGPPRLEAQPLDFVGVAKQLVYENRRTEDIGTTIVGVQLWRGEILIVNEATNFAGLCGPSERIEDCTHLLTPEQRNLLAAAREVPADAQ